jgi:hypothetical protein
MLEYIDEASSIELAHSALQWITLSERPLDLGELVEALALNDCDGKRLNLNATFVDPRDLLRVCSSLLHEESESGSGSQGTVSIRLCHYTVEVNMSPTI